MKVVFDPRASDDLDRVFAWINKENPRAAFDLMARIEARVMLLEDPKLTHMGRPGLVLGTRELIVGPYIIVYQVDDERGEVIVVGVLHGAQKRGE